MSASGAAARSRARRRGCDQPSGPQQQKPPSVVHKLGPSNLPDRTHRPTLTLRGAHARHRAAQPAWGNSCCRSYVYSYSLLQSSPQRGRPAATATREEGAKEGRRRRECALAARVRLDSSRATTDEAESSLRLRSEHRIDVCVMPAPPCFGSPAFSLDGPLSTSTSTPKHRRLDWLSDLARRIDATRWRQRQQRQTDQCSWRRQQRRITPPTASKPGHRRSIARGASRPPRPGPAKER